jgi:hypothetical protein
MWYEGAWGYHFYTMDALHYLTEAAFRCGINLYGDGYKRMFAAPLDLAMPDGGLPAFNDSSAATAMGNANYEIALARYKAPGLAAPLAGNARRSLQAFVNGVVDLPSPTSVAEASRNFPISGYAILRADAGKDATWVCLKYGPHGGSHGHPDKNSFVLYAAGHVLAGDPGTVAYLVPIHAGWYRTTLAHNTLVVDETSQHAATGASLDFRTGDGWSGSLTDAGYAYGGVLFRRAACLIGKDLVVFLDLVGTDNGRPRTLDLACHLSGSWAGAPQGDAAVPPDKPGYSYLRDLHALTTDSGYTATVKGPGDLEVSAIFAASPGLPTTFWTATGAGTSAGDRVPVVIARRQSAATAFAWAIAISPTGQGDAAASTAGASPAISIVPVTSQETGASVPSDEAASALVKSIRGTFLIVANPAGRSIRAGTWTGNDKLTVVKQ